MTGSNPHAIALIEDMLATAKRDITLTEQTLEVQLAELERRVATVRSGLAQGLNIDSHWVRESAHKVEDSISKRRVLYNEVASLAHVMKAAGGE